MTTAEVTEKTTRTASVADGDIDAMRGAWWKLGSGALMMFVIYGAFFIAKGASGFGAGGDTARVMFFHVPAAVLCSVIYFVGVFYAARYLFIPRHANLETDAKSAISMELGFLFCLLATITGSIFAGIQWGTFWNWDPRETSIIIMLLLYAAYLVLRGAMSEKPTARARVSAVYALIALVPAQFLIWAVPRLMASNHPTTVLQNPRDTSPDFLIVLYPAFVAFTLVLVWMFQLRLRAWKLAANREAAR
jgi:heme exporter protein C